MDYNKQPEEVILKIHPISVPHVESKPIHRDQSVIEKEANGSLTIKLNLMINYELKATLMGFGEGVEVLEPVSLRNEIRSLQERAIANYK